ncbi:hypothetical protein KJ673_02305, partial [Patescibacteria group bacterium]|nr:hypothetical protein [Patescibacteria group bacterium]MCG2687808.1 hypothetical protein [Candidatus Parcubacteria bacterium]
MSIDSMERQGPEIEAKARLVKLEAKVNAYVRLAERILQQNPEDENAKFIQGRIKRMQTRFKEIDAEKTLGNRDQVKADFASHNVLKLFTDSEVHGGSMLSVVDRIKNTYG